MRELRLTMFSDGIVACRADGLESTVYVRDNNREQILQHVGAWLALQPHTRPARKRRQRVAPPNVVDTALELVRKLTGVDVTAQDVRQSRAAVHHNARVVAVYALRKLGVTAKAAAAAVGRTTEHTRRYGRTYDDPGTIGDSIRKVTASVVALVINAQPQQHATTQGQTDV